MNTNWTVEKKDEIEKRFINLITKIGMDIPSNFEDIVQFIYEDVCETADEKNWHDGDIAIGFRRWIEKNTAGIIFVQIRSDKKFKKMDEKEEKSTFLNEIFLPFGNIYSNFLTQQDYNNDYFIAQLANSLKVPGHVIPFTYLPLVENKEASMSFHLTKREKKDIVKAYDNEFNQAMEAKLKQLLKVK